MPAAGAAGVEHHSPRWLSGRQWRKQLLHRSGVESGFDAHPVLVDRADALGKQAWKRLKREAKYEVRTEPRRRPEDVKEAVVVEREFDNIRLVSEDVA